jgi:hypothetical protein
MTDKLPRFVVDLGDSRFLELMKLTPESFGALNPKDLIGVPVYYAESGFIEVWPKPSHEYNMLIRLPHTNAESD